MKKSLWMQCNFLSIFLTTPCFAHPGIVVSEHYLASQVGAQILKQGGNAIDAAVAVGYALAVVNPCCGNIGGGGFMTIHFANGKDTFINFREKAPLQLQSNMFLNQQGKIIPALSQQGYLAVGIPGTVLGLEYARTHYGTLAREKLLQPAYQLAKKGFIVSPYLAKQFSNYANDFRKYANITAIFLKNGQPYRAGQRLIQTDLAKTIADIAKCGPRVFYQGWIAQAIVSAAQTHGGSMSLGDFKRYRVTEVKPIYCQYKGLQIISAPPPSSGGVTLCELLNILENFPLKQMGFGSKESTRVIIEAMRYAFTDRNQGLGDPKYVHNDIEKLISKKYAKKISHHIQQYQINPERSSIEPIKELTDTTHYSIIDKWGNAVAVTYTLNGLYGAGVMAGRTGFFLNNEMDDFTIQAGTSNKFGLVQKEKNRLAGGKQPLSSMTPTIILKNNKVFLVLGSPGGPRIITSVLLTLLNFLEYDKPLQKAVASGRFHYQVKPNVVSYEKHALPGNTLKGLRQLKYSLLQQPAWGAIEAIELLANGQYVGVNDPRRPDGAWRYAN